MNELDDKERAKLASARRTIEEALRTIGDIEKASAEIKRVREELAHDCADAYLQNRLYVARENMDLWLKVLDDDIRRVTHIKIR